MPNEAEELSKNDQFNESIMTGLRTIWGVSLAEVEAEFGIDYKNQLLASAEKFINSKIYLSLREKRSNLLMIKRLFRRFLLVMTLNF